MEPKKLSRKQRKMNQTFEGKIKFLHLITPVLQGILCPRELCAPEPNSLALKVGNMVSLGDFGFPWSFLPNTEFFEVI